MTVAEENSHAKNVYERFGFTDTGIVYGIEQVYKFQVKR